MAMIFAWPVNVWRGTPLLKHQYTLLVVVVGNALEMKIMKSNYKVLKEKKTTAYILRTERILNDPGALLERCITRHFSNPILQLYCAAL